MNLTITPLTRRSPASDLRQLDDLMLETFEFSFEAWRQAGLWPDDYTAYGIFEDGQLLANTSLYRMDLRIRGRHVEAYQVGAVATCPERRGQGLSRRLLEEIFTRHPGARFFLFAGPDVRDFYPRFGFRHILERQPCLNATPDGPPQAMRRLALSDPRVAAYLRGRAVFSQVLDCSNALPVNHFHLMQPSGRSLYELPEPGVLLVTERQAETLHIFDIFAPRPVRWDEIAPGLCFPGAREIRFGFNPDWLAADHQYTALEDACLFVRGDWDLPESFIFPLLART